MYWREFCGPSYAERVAYNQFIPGAARSPTGPDHPDREDHVSPRSPQTMIPNDFIQTLLGRALMRGAAREIPS